MSSVSVFPTVRKVFVAAILGACVFLIPNGVQSATSDSATLHWAPNQESDLGGYRVYHGTTPGVYGNSQDAGNTSTYRYASLESNKTHYFTVTAYDLSKNESLPSPEVFKTIIGPDGLLSVSINGEGTVTSNPAGLSCSNGTCSGTFTQGSSVTLTAVPSNDRSAFSGWSGACTGTGSCVVALSTSSALVKATFGLSLKEQERLAAEAAKLEEQQRLAAEAAKLEEEQRLAAEAAKLEEEQRLAAEAAKKEQEQLTKAEKQKQLARAKYQKQQEMAKAEFLKRREMAKAEYLKQREMAKVEYRKRHELYKSENRKQREMAKAEFLKRREMAKAEYLKQRELLAKA